MIVSNVLRLWDGNNEELKLRKRRRLRKRPLRNEPFDLTDVNDWPNVSVWRFGSQDFLIYLFISPCLSATLLLLASDEVDLFRKPKTSGAYSLPDFIIPSYRSLTDQNRNLGSWSPLVSSFVEEIDDDERKKKNERDQYGRLLAASSNKDKILSDYFVIIAVRGTAFISIIDMVGHRNGY